MTYRNESGLPLDDSRVVAANYTIEVTDITQHELPVESNSLDVQQTHTASSGNSSEGGVADGQQETWRGLAGFYTVTAGAGVASHLTLSQVLPSVVAEQELREEVALLQKDLQAHQDAAGIMDVLSIGSTRLEGRTAELKEEISQIEKQYPSGFAHEVQSAVSVYAVPVIALTALAIKTTMVHRSYRST